MSFKLLEVGMDALRRVRIGRAALVAAAICASAFAPVYADKTVSENTQLTQDTDWSDQGTVTIAEGVTLDLCGHSLTVAGLTGGGIVTDSANPYYTTFTDVSANAYIQLEYLQSAGSQYIDTGYRHNASSVADMKVAITVAPGNTWYCYYGSRTSEGNQNEFAGWVYKTHHWTGVAGAKGEQTSWSFTVNVPFLVHLDGAANATCSVDGHTFTHSKALTDSGYNDMLFCGRQGGSSPFFAAKAAIYYCTIKEGETVKRDFVAAKRLSDGVLGMLDKENGVFYTNKGGGAFIAGDYAVNAEAAEFGSSGVLRIAVPANTTLALDDMPLIVGDVKILKEGAGVLTYNEATSSQKYFLGGYEDHSAPLTAVWTGAANNNDFNDAANWSCTNDLGSALSGVAPDATTVKYVLTADADWTAKGAIALGTGVTLDLNGNSLTATSITGDGIVTDTVNLGDSTFKDADGNLYVQLEYIASSGTQYIDTGYRHNANSVVDMKVAITVAPGNTWYCYYGSRTSEGNQNEFAGWVYKTHHWTGVAGAKGEQTSWSFAVNEPFLVHLDGAASATCSVDGHTFTHAKVLTDSGYNDYLFCGRQGSSVPFFAAKARIYYCTIKEGDTVKRDFVAAIRASDRVLGMFDKENGVFYENKGSGTFVAGPVKASGVDAAASLHVTVAENATLSLGGLATICGNVKVVKEGAGVLTLPVDGQYFVGGLEVAAGTLSMTQTAAFFVGMPITATAGGTIEIAAGDGASYANDFTLAGGTLKVLASGTGNTTTAAIAGTLALETGAADAQPVVSIDMTDCTSATFQLNTTALNVGSGVTAAPGFVSLADTTAYEASIVDGTAIKVEHLTSPATAVWTGLGEAGNFDDPGNWSCSNKYGVALANTLPDNTTLTFRLGTDADWTAKGAIALGEGVKLDLAGRTLTAASITGDGVVTDTSADNVIVADDCSMFQK
ncbi:MAG: hypothetical protein IJQ00_06540, partial [Kiritimatiellae bacterium]|nr:hypothetical protein [Kiritimatiellia bacterium]